jgi:outer membrane receptor protein involved in Fe transport
MGHHTEPPHPDGNRISASYRDVGADWRDNGNTFRLDSHSTLDAFVSVRFSNSTVLTLTGRNLTESV